MQIAMDILRVLFFPGLLFMVFCGGLLILLEGRLKSAFYGGDAPRLRSIVGRKEGDGQSAAGELTVMAVSLAAMGVAGVMLVGMKGDLLALLLLLAAIEVVPLFLAAAAGVEERTRAPLLFRTAFLRMATIVCVMVCVSLRFPEDLASGLETFKGEGAFHAVQLWSGRDFAFILASLVCAALAMLVFLLGRPACRAFGEAGADGIKGSYMLAAEGSERAVILLLFVVIFLGYPWEGGLWLLAWSGAAFGTALLSTAARAVLEGRDKVTLRRLQGAAALFALLSLALAFVAVI
jgi:phage-related holin